ncbi:MAG: ATP-dependent DNA helicase [Candidatus Odinarchaeota archaeon]
MAEKVAEPEKTGKKRKKGIIPFSNIPIYQESMIDTVEACLMNRKSLMVSAPTGTGKTISVLFPALKYAFQEGKRIFYTTAKSTQQKLVIETMQEFKKQRITFTMVVLQAKEKSCLNSSYYCHPDFCPYIRDYYERLKPEYIEKLLKKKVVTPRTVKNLAKKVRLCPFELSLDLSLETDLILGDYNYVFDPNVYLKRFFFDRKYDDFLLVVDEAHNLYSRGKGYYSPVISIRELERIRDDVEQKRGKIYKPFKLLVKQLLDHVSKTLETVGDKHQALVDIDVGFFHSLKTALDDNIEFYFIWKNKNALNPTRDDPVEKFYQIFNRFHTILKISQELEEFRYYAVSGPYGSLNILCLDPSKFLNKRIKGFWNCTAISATLLPANFYKRVLGMPADTEVLVTPSPFPTKNRKIAVIPEVSTLYRERSQSARKVAWIINSIANINPGNYFAFFPSFDYMKIVEQELKPKGTELLVQDRIMSERSRRQFLEKMESNKKGLLCLGVMGGIFSEGVDYPGELLKGAFLVGPGLPAYNFENELVRQHFDRKYKGEGWKFAYLYPGLNRVIQAAGRPIRTMNDTGIIILLGRRFATRDYSELFPRDWYRTLPEELVMEDYLGETSNFWKSHGMRTNSYSYEE